MTHTIKPLTVTSKARGPAHVTHPVPHPVNVVERQTTRYQATSDGLTGGSVAATVRRAGTTQSVETVPGQPHSRTDVHTAAHMGLIEPNGRGGWRDVRKAR